jgi:hypothetical protein
LKFVSCRRFLIGALLALVIPLCLATLLGCSSLSDLQNQLSASGVPVIQSVSPAQGVVGAAVAVQGTNFGTSQGVLVFQDPKTSRNVTAPVSSWGDTMIVASVPGMDSTTGILKIGLQTTGQQVPVNPGLFTLLKN